MATKKELEDKVKLLTSKLKEALSTVKEAASNEIHMEGVGMSIIIKDNEYQLVRLAFDVESGQAKVVSVEDVGRNTKVYAIAMMRGKQFLVDEIMGNLSL